MAEDDEEPGLTRARSGDDAAAAALVPRPRRRLRLRRGDPPHQLRLLANLPTSANGQPAVSSYLWNDDARAHLSSSIEVLTMRDERICEITSFIGAEHFALLGLPAAFP